MYRGRRTKATQAVQEMAPHPPACISQKMMPAEESNVQGPSSTGVEVNTMRFEKEGPQDIDGLHDEVMISESEKEAAEILNSMSASCKRHDEWYSKISAEVNDASQNMVDMGNHYAQMNEELNDLAALCENDIDGEKIDQLYRSLPLEEQQNLIAFTI